MSDIQSLITGKLELPSLPLVVSRLNRLLSDPTASMTQIAQLIRQDPALAGRVLKVVNSPIYPYAGRIDSLSRALTILGVRELRSLAYALTATQLFRGIPGELVDMERFWRHSLYTALAARALTEAALGREIERFFIEGLLHDLGALLLLAAWPDQARRAVELARERGTSVAEAERELMGFDHAAVGGELMAHWGLPGSVVTAVRYHHAPQDAEGAAFDVALIHLADRIADSLPEGRLYDLEPAPIPEETWTTLGLAPDVLDGVTRRVRYEFDGACQALLPATA